VAALLLSAAPALHAQAVPTPGTVREPLRKPAIEAPAVAPPSVTQPTPALRPEVPAGGPKIPVQRFAIEGNSAFSDDTLRAVIADLRGKSLTLLEIYSAADRLTAYYRAHGYTLATVTVPAQKLSQGTVRLAVVEGRLGHLGFEGNRRYSSAYLRRQMDELRSGDVIQRKVLERELLLLNDLPGLTARAVVKPGEKYGTADLLVRTGEQPLTASVQLNNYGRESIGQIRGVGNLTFNDPLHLGDRLSLTVVHADGGRMNYGAVDYSLAVGPRGTRAGLSLSRFVYRVDTDAIGFSGQTLRGTGNDVRAQLTHPLIRSRRSNLIVGFGITHSESPQGGSLTPALVVDPKGGDRFVNLFDLSALYSYEHADNAISTFGVTVSSNFRHNRTGTRDNAQYGKFEFSASHTRALPAGWTLSARANGVVALDPLMSIQRFRIGGPGNVRAFPSSELSGDQGFMVSLEGSHAIKLIDGVATRGRVFWDAGVVHRKPGSRAVSVEKGHESLTGVGTGVTVNWKRYTLDLEGVFPTDSHRTSDSKSNARFWLQIGAAF